MTTDAWLAIAHHLAVFSILGVLTAELALIRQDMQASDVQRLGRIDGMYGALAITVIVAGIARVVWGAKPAAFYLENPVFWFKMAAFATVGLLSIRPTMRYRAWTQALAGEVGAGTAGTAGTGAVPPHVGLVDAREVELARRGVMLQLAVFALIPTFAAAMARGIGL